MMSDLISLEHISDNLTLSEVDGVQKEELRSVLSYARKCVEDENIQSSDCRLAISKVITQQTKVMYVLIKSLYFSFFYSMFP